MDHLIMDASEAVRRLPAICDALTARGMNTSSLIVEPPASTGEVAAMEEQIGLRLPDSFRRVLTSVSRRVSFDWFIPKGFEFEDPFKAIFSGDLSWSLTGLPDLLTYHQSWIDEVISELEDPLGDVWRNKFPFMGVGNGDFLTIDLDDNFSGQVVYLCHDLEEEGHGYSMAPSFEDLLVRWIPLACVGGEVEQWMPFYSADAAGIDPMSEAAREWIQLMNFGRDIADS